MQPTRADIAMIEMLYQQHSPALVLFALALTGERSRAQDAVHQVFLKLLERGSLGQAVDVKAYLFACVRNAILNDAKVRERHVPLNSQSTWFDPPNRDYAAELNLRRALAAGQVRTNVKAADLRFVLDRLFELNRAAGVDSRVAGRLDLTRVAAMGHSAGGSVAVRACQLDPRIKACISLDGGGYPFGAFLNDHNAPSPKQPFLFLEAYRPPMHMDPVKWNAFLSRMDQQLRDCSGGSYHVTLKSPGMIHGSFSDEPLLMARSDAQAQKTALHNLQLVETVTRAFLDRYLRDNRETLFEGPTDASREIVIARNSG